MPVTIKDIARELTISPSTVSAVLRGKSYCYASKELKRKVRQKAEELGYVPNHSARMLAGESSKTIAFLTSLFGSEVHMNLTEALSRRLARTDFKLMIENVSGYDSKRKMASVRELVGRGIDGFILSGFHDLPNLDRIIPETTPYVSVFHSHADDSTSPLIDFDLYEGARLIGRHLLDLGHRRIGCCASSSTANLEKKRGLTRALADGEFAEDDFITGDDMRNVCARAAEWILEKNLTACVCFNDHWAACLINALSALGLRVPDDVSVTGYDDLKFCEFFSPPLTTIRQDVKAQATLVVDQLLDAINRKSRISKGLIITPELIVRKSSGPCLATESQ